jgi:hypothetical protein
MLHMGEHIHFYAFYTGQREEVKINTGRGSKDIYTIWSLLTLKITVAFLPNFVRPIDLHFKQYLACRPN